MAEHRNLNRKEAAAYLNLSIVTLDRAISKGKIAFFRIGRRVIFSESHLDNFLYSNEVKVKVKSNKQDLDLGLAK